MAANWMRRTVLVALCATTALLAACGSSSTESAINPSRFIGFGDAFTDLGQKGTRYTVNNGSVNNWAAQLATRYGKTIAPSATGGTSYATAHARIALKPDAVGDATNRTITEQIDTFLASNRFGSEDVVLVNGGISDIIANMAAVQAGTMTSADMVAASRKAGQDLAVQVRRLVTAGAKYVAVSGTYDLGKTPWAKSIKQESLLSEASGRFNEAFLVAVVDMGANVLYIDSAYYVNLYISNPVAYRFNSNNISTAVCTSVDAGAGIGIGTGKVNSALCNTSTLLPNANIDAYIFADDVYMTPSAHRQLGDYAYDQIRARW